MDRRLNGTQFDQNDTIWRLYVDYIEHRDLQHIIVIEGVAVLGLLTCVAGYRLLKLAIFLSGFILAFCAFYVFSPSFIDTKYCCGHHGKEEIHVLASVICGIAAGLLLSRVYRLGVFIIGKSLGLLVAIVILHSPWGSNFKNGIQTAALFTVCAIAIGSLVVKFEKPLVTIATSFLGSYVFVCGIDVFVNSTFSYLVLGFIIYIKQVIIMSVKARSAHVHDLNLPHIDYPNRVTHVGLTLMITWQAVAWIGVLIQFKFTPSCSDILSKRCCKACEKKDKLSSDEYIYIPVYKPKSRPG